MSDRQCQSSIVCKTVIVVAMLHVCRSGNTTSRCFRLTTLPRHRSFYRPSACCHATMSDEDPIVQYVALRRDLWKEEAWPLGSIVAQGCHAATAALWLSRDTDVTTLYCSSDNLDHMRKVRGCVESSMHVLETGDMPSCFGNAGCLGGIRRRTIADNCSHIRGSRNNP